MTADSLYWVGLNSTATYAQRDAARKAVSPPRPGDKLPDPHLRRRDPHR